MKEDETPKNILVKLPVKIGDTIMAAYVLRAIKEKYPESQLDVIMDVLTVDLAGMMPFINHIHHFSKKKYRGAKGNFRCGHEIAKQKSYNLFICLPFSFSSAMAGYFTKSKIRIGFSEEHRGFLFTKSIKRPKGMHIVEEYNYLFEQFVGEKIAFRPLDFQPEENMQVDFENRKCLVLNIKSGPLSRSIPIEKSISIAESILENYKYDIILSGAPNEVDYVNQVKAHFQDNDRIIDMSGKTDLMELAYIISKSEAMITTDSGNAHIANAVGTPTVVLFGATLLHRAYPYDQRISRTLNNSSLPCLPCNSEHCKLGDNRCLSTISNADIHKALNQLVSLDN